MSDISAKPNIGRLLFDDGYGSEGVRSNFFLTSALIDFLTSAPADKQSLPVSSVGSIFHMLEERVEQ